MKHFSLFMLALCLLMTLTSCSLHKENVADSQIFEATIMEDTIAALQETEPASTTNTEEKLTEPATDYTFESYLVKIQRSDFPIYSGPGYNYKQAGTVEEAGVYTIVAEETDTEGTLWGKLKSGAGWVDLSLIEKEEKNTPLVTAYRTEQDISAFGNCYYCQVFSANAHKIVFKAGAALYDVSFFFIDATDAYTKGLELFNIDYWESSKPLVASVYFQSLYSSYGLEFTDSNGKTYIYTLSESGNDASISFVPFTNTLYKSGSQGTPCIPASLDMLYSSGAGAWSSSLTLQSSGRFSGYFHDTDADGGADKDYYATTYLCDFEGSFRIIGEGAHSLTLSLSSLTKKDYGVSYWIEGEMRYVPSDAAGIEGGATFVLYMPYAPLGALPEMMQYKGYDRENGILGRYALYNTDTGEVFYSDMV